LLDNNFDTSFCTKELFAVQQCKQLEKVQRGAAKASTTTTPYHVLQFSKEQKKR
jgi:hypothetical protein